MSHWFRTAYRHMDLWVTFLWFRFLAARVVLGDKFTQRVHFFENSPNFTYGIFFIVLPQLLSQWLVSFQTIIQLHSITVAHADVVGNSRHFERKRVHRSLHTPKVKPGVKVGNSWQFDFRSGCRNVSHHYRQQSFSGLHSPGLHYYMLTSGSNHLLY